MTEHGNSDDGYTDIGNTMDGAARRAGQWKLEWQKKNQDLDAVKDRILVSNFFRDATFASAFLAEKRKSRRPADTDLTGQTSTQQYCASCSRACFNAIVSCADFSGE
eukprot:1819651-Rhodomonas_salina.1